MQTIRNWAVDFFIDLVVIVSLFATIDIHSYWRILTGAAFLLGLEQRIKRTKSSD